MFARLLELNIRIEKKPELLRKVKGDRAHSEETGWLHGHARAGERVRAAQAVRSYLLAHQA